MRQPPRNQQPPPIKQFPQPQKPQRPEQPKRKIRTELFFLGALIIGAIYLVGYLSTHTFGDSVGQVRIEQGYMSAPPVFSGVIVRDEAVYGSSAANMIFHVENHTRVRRGHAVASMQGGGSATSESPGVVSFHTDGFETLLTPSNLESVARSMIDGQSHAAAHAAAFKVVRSHDWYVASYIPRDYMPSAPANTAITIFVAQPDGLLPLDAMIYRLIDRGAYFYVVFQTNLETLRFIDQRHISFQFQRNPEPGLRVPSSAVVERSAFPVPADFVTGDYYGTLTVLREGSSSRVAVAGWWASGGATFYILADGGNFRVGDVLVHEGELSTLDTIEVMLGVFVANRGHTAFRTITMPENFDADSDYIILSPLANPNIRLFDWIIADASAVYNRLLLN